MTGTPQDMPEFVGRVGIGNGWTMVFEEPVLAGAVEGLAELNFSNADMLVLPNVIPVQDGITDEWLRDWNLAASAKAVDSGLATRDLGRIDGTGWVGSLAYGVMKDSGESKLLGYLAGAGAVLHITVRFFDPGVVAAARRLIGAVEHDPATAAQMADALELAKQVFQWPESPPG